MDTALLTVGLVTEAIVLGLLLFRRIYKSLPVFASYLAWSIVSDLSASLLIRHFPKHDLQIYLVSATVDALLMFCILMEISMSVLNPIRNSLPRWVRLEVAAVMLCLCVAVWLFTKPSAFSDIPLRLVIAHLDMTTSTVRVLFFVLLALLSHFLSLGWRDRELQIATGFGIYSFVRLTVELIHGNPALWSSSYMPPLHSLDQIASASYLLVMFYWVYTFAQAESKRREFTPQMHHLLVALAGNARDTRIAMTRDAAPKSDRRFPR